MHEDKGKLNPPHAQSATETRERPFAGYVEQCTAAYYDEGGLTLREHTRDAMERNKGRTATEVYVHVIRAGALAWYHSDVVRRCTPQPGDACEGWVKVGKWLEEDDPLAVAIEEARAAGLRVFADMGMNVTYITENLEYKGLAERFSLTHPECLVPGHRMFLDYRHEAVRDYAAAIARELITKYDVDGINLDFARFGHNKAFDEPSLVDVLRRIHEDRESAQRKWGHPVTIATRIPSPHYAGKAAWAQAIYGGEHPWFADALRTWAAKGWIDRVMLCCPDPEEQKTLSLARYRAAIAGSGVSLWGDLYVLEGRSEEEVLDTARQWVRQGLDGGFFIYTVDRPQGLEKIDRKLRTIDDCLNT